MTEPKKKQKGKPKGGARAGAGRKKGSVTKKTAETARKAAAKGITPVEYMLSLVHNKKLKQAVRLDAAKAAAPYVHPRLSSVEVKQDLTINDLTDKQLDSEISRLANEAGALGIVERESTTH